MKENLIGQVGPEQVEAWKKEHKAVYAVKVDGHIGYLRKPTRVDLSYAQSTCKGDAIGYSEAILRNCWLGGSEAIKEDDELFLGVSAQLDKLVQIKSAELEQL